MKIKPYTRSCAGALFKRRILGAPYVYLLFGKPEKMNSVLFLRYANCSNGNFLDLLKAQLNKYVPPLFLINKFHRVLLNDCIIITYIFNYVNNSNIKQTHT